MRIITYILILLFMFVQYTKIPLIGNIAYIALFLLFVLYIIQTRDDFYIAKVYIPVIISLLIWLLIILIQSMFREEYNFENAIIDYVQRFTIIISLITIISNLSKETLMKYYETTILIFFMLGVTLLLVKSFLLIDLVNENAIAFFIMPFLGFLFIKKKGTAIRITIFISGLALLYVTSGRASLLAYLMTPILYFFMCRYPFRHIGFLMMVLISIIIPFFFIDFLLLFDSSLSGRSFILQIYSQAITSDIKVLIFGSAEYIYSDERLLGLGTHHTWIGLIWTHGLVGVFVNIFIITYLLKVKSNNKGVLGLSLIIYYIFIIQLFESVNLGGISYISFLLLFSLLVLRKENTPLAVTSEN